MRTSALLLAAVVVLSPVPPTASHLRDPRLGGHGTTALDELFPSGPVHLVRSAEKARVKVGALVTNRSAERRAAPIRCYLDGDPLITWNPVLDPGEAAYVHASRRLEPGTSLRALDARCEPWARLIPPPLFSRHFVELAQGGYSVDYPRSATRIDFEIFMRNVDVVPRAPVCTWYVPRGRGWRVVPREIHASVAPGERTAVRGTFYLRPEAEYEVMDDMEEVCH